MARIANTNVNRTRRNLCFQGLDGRSLFAADLAVPAWVDQQPALVSVESMSPAVAGLGGVLDSTAVGPRELADVNGDGMVSHLDALVIINRLERGELDSTMDQNGDGRLTPLDVLTIVNRLNRETIGSGPSGELGHHPMYQWATGSTELIAALDDHPIGPYLPGRMSPLVMEFENTLGQEMEVGPWERRADAFWASQEEQRCINSELSGLDV